MKNKEIKSFFKRLSIAVLTFITPLTLTACSFEYDTVPNIPDISDTIIQIAQEIDETDFTEKEQINDLTEKINDLYDENQFQKVSLVRVVDGDTIVVDMVCTDEACNDKDHYSKVRLIGINTPESVAPETYRTENTEEGVKASDYVKDLLSETDFVYLEKDISDTDKYDRLLRYVWLEVPNEDKLSQRDLTEISEKMLNAYLLDKDIAEVSIYKPDVKYADEFQMIKTHQTDLGNTDR